jgi:hypothetical protein
MLITRFYSEKEWPHTTRKPNDYLEFINRGKIIRHASKFEVDR